MQSLGTLAVSDFTASVTEPLIKLEVFTGFFSPFIGWTKYNTKPPGKRYSADGTLDEVFPPVTGPLPPDIGAYEFLGPPDTGRRDIGAYEFQGITHDAFMYGGGWVDVSYVLGVNEKLLKEISFSLAGSSLSPAPVAGTWNARVFNKDAIFFPRHPTSSYTKVFQIGRPVRLFIGLKKSGVEHWFQQIIGVMANPNFSDRSLEVDVSGFDYTQVLSDTKMKSPDNYWGATLSPKSVNTVGGTTIYAIGDANCTGVYYATLNGVPIYNGNDWTYDSAAQTIILNVDPGGVYPLIIYYFEAQVPENVIADILVTAGLYIDRTTALANMTHTDTTFTIDRVFFPAGNSALYSIGQICERCNYRFYFKYDGKPVFNPLPTAKAVGLEDLALTHNQIANYRFWADDSELYNRVTIEGEEQASPIWEQATESNKFRQTYSNLASILEIGEKTLTISNPFFQDQATVDASCATYLAFYLADKKYFSFDLIGCPIPLELWDTVRIQVRLTPSVASGKKYGAFQYSTSGEKYKNDGVIFAQRGLVRDIKVNKFTNTIVCQEVT